MGQLPSFLLVCKRSRSWNRWSQKTNLFVDKLNYFNTKTLIQAKRGVRKLQNHWSSTSECDRDTVDPFKRFFTLALLAYSNHRCCLELVYDRVCCYIDCHIWGMVERLPGLSLSAPCCVYCKWNTERARKQYGPRCNNSSSAFLISVINTLKSSHCVEVCINLNPNSQFPL